MTSAPAVHGGRLYATDTKGNLHILNARTGQSFLRFRVPPTATGPPVVAGGLAYFPSGGRIYAVDAGAQELPGEYQLKQVWARLWVWQVPGVPRPPGQLGGRWRISAAGNGGFVASPAAAPDAIYLADTRGNLYARDAATGRELWQVQQPGIPVGSPLVVGQWVYFSVDHALYALERATGRLHVRTTSGLLYAIQ